MKTFWNIYTKVIVGFVIAALFAAGGVNYYSKKESDTRFYQKTVADTTFVKVTDGFELRDSVWFKGDTITSVTMPTGTSTTDVATTAFLMQNAWVNVNGGVTTRITHTGTTAETTLHTMTFPSARLGLNGRILMTGIFDSTTGDGYTKTIYIKINGTTIATYSAVTSTLIYPYVEVICRNSITNKIIIAGLLNTTVNADAPTATIDTSTGTVTVTLTCIISNATASSYIDAFSISTIY